MAPGEARRPVRRVTPRLHSRPTGRSCVSSDSILPLPRDAIGFLLACPSVSPPPTSQTLAQLFSLSLSVCPLLFLPASSLASVLPREPTGLLCSLLVSPSRSSPVDDGDVSCCCGYCRGLPQEQQLPRCRREPTKKNEKGKQLQQRKKMQNTYTVSNL